jgi:hypothetical protein
MDRGITAMRKKTNVGTFGLGVLQVTLMADPDLEGGNYEMRPSPAITVGFKDNRWPEVLGILLHESFEMAHMVRGHKFRSIPTSSFDSADVKFVFDHSEHSRACADVGYFIDDAIPKLAEVYKKHQDDNSKNHKR